MMKVPAMQISRIQMVSPACCPRPMVMDAGTAVDELMGMGILTERQRRIFLKWADRGRPVGPTHPLVPVLQTIWLWCLMPGSATEQ